MPPREEVKRRLEEVSHATWMLQGIRDYGRAFADNLAANDQNRRGTPGWDADVDEANRRLEAVRDEGRSLDEFSEEESQRVMDHDRERAEESVKALEALGIAFD